MHLFEERQFSEGPLKPQKEMNLPESSPHGSPKHTIAMIAVGRRRVRMLFETMRMREALLLVMTCQASAHQNLQS